MTLRTLSYLKYHIKLNKMDLNKELKLNIDFKNIDLKSLLKGPLALLVISVIVVLYCLGDIISRFSNQDMLIANQNQTINLTQQKADISSEYNKLLTENKKILKHISNSPKTKSEMTAVLTKLVSLYRIKLIKLTTNENSNELDVNFGSETPLEPGIEMTQSVGSSSLIIDLEGVGSFKNITLFTEKLKEVLAASEIQSFKLAKLTEGKGLQLNLIVKFSTPPNDLSVPKVAQTLIYDDGYSLAFKTNPYMIKTGFVEIEKNLDAMDNSMDGDIVPMPQNNEQLKDPFADPGEGSSFNGQKPSEIGDDGLPVAEPVYYLSGTLDSDEYRMCTVNMPSGETKIYSENEKINDQITILSIHENSIKICGVCKGNFKEIKIGEEVSL